MFLKDNICSGLACFFKSPFWLSPLSFNDGLLPFCSFFFLSIFLFHYSFLIFCIIFCCILLDYLDILSIGLLDITLCHALVVSLKITIGTNRESSINIHILSDVRWIADGKLQCNTGSPVYTLGWAGGIGWGQRKKAKEVEDICIIMADSSCFF